MSAAERIEAQAADWAARRDSGRWTEADQQALETWIEASLAHRVAFLRLAESWERADRLAALRSPAPQRAPGWGERRARFSMQGLAACLVMVVAACGVWLSWHGQGEGDRYATEVGARTQVALADGTRLTLNTDSRVRSVVGGSTRTVWLEQGEVYFDVAHDKTRPFVVMAGDRRITVLGTRFSVRQRGDQVSVLVEEGRVQLEPAEVGAGARPTVVTRNDAVIVDPGHMLLMKKTPEQIANELSWRQGKIVLDQLTLGEAAAEFNRYNRKKLVIMDAATAQLRIGGTFDVANVQSFALLLHQGFGLVVQEKGDEIRISS
nr:FecR family protein [uncultured Roseateles sp.]